MCVCERASMYLRDWDCECVFYNIFFFHSLTRRRRRYRSPSVCTKIFVTLWWCVRLSEKSTPELIFLTVFFFFSFLTSHCSRSIFFFAFFSFGRKCWNECSQLASSQFRCVIRKLPNAKWVPYIIICEYVRCTWRLQICANLKWNHQHLGTCDLLYVAV